MFQHPFETIVVGVDFSPYSKVVVKQAKLLARTWKAKLVLVHAVENPADYAMSMYGRIYLPDLPASKEHAARIKKAYGPLGPSVQVIAKSSTPVRLVLETAEKCKHPLIFVGYKGFNRIPEFFFGSTAQQLALRSKHPVWIHRGNKIVLPKKILIPHDLSTASNHSIDVVEKLALASPISYEVFHVNRQPFPILDYNNFQNMRGRMRSEESAQIRKLLRTYPRIRVTQNDGDVTEEIVKRSKDFDVLALAHHNKGLFSRSETVSLMRKVRTPLIVAH